MHLQPITEASMSLSQLIPGTLPLYPGPYAELITKLASLLSLILVFETKFSFLP